MLDKRSFALLNAINNECDNSGYKIFSFDELISNLPIKLMLEREGLIERLNALSNHEFISLKYLGEDEVCLRPLIKGRMAIENKTDREKNELKAERKYLIFSLLGGFLGGLISGILPFVIKLLGGA